MVQKSHDIYSGFFLLLVSVAMFVITYSFKMLTDSQVGPDFMPKIIAAFIGFVSITIIVSGFKDVKKKKDLEEQLEDNKDVETLAVDPIEEITYFPVIVSVALILGYVILMPTIGFLIMTAIYLYLQMNVLSDKTNRKPVAFMVVSIVSSAVTYYIFRSIFYVMLPSGIFG